MLISLAVNRCGLDSQLQPVAMQSRPLILAGFGLNMEVQRQNAMFPMVPIQPITGLANQVCDLMQRRQDDHFCQLQNH